MNNFGKVYEAHNQNIYTHGLIHIYGHVYGHHMYGAGGIDVLYTRWTAHQCCTMIL